jgi:hypothetical protein
VIFATQPPLQLGKNYFLPVFLAALLRAAHRAFIIRESLRRPAGVIPPPFFPLPLLASPLLAAHLARAAPAILARAAADIWRRGRALCPAPSLGANPPSSELSLASSLSICRRTDIAASRFLSDICMSTWLLVRGVFCKKFAVNRVGESPRGPHPAVAFRHHRARESGFWPKLCRCIDK